MSIKLATAASVAALLMAAPALASDLGGSCCADLEDRIAELEATAARKGNRKMSLMIYGEVNKALLWVDGDASGHDYEYEDDEVYVGDKWSGSFTDKRVIDNSTSPSFFGLTGSAQISPDWTASFVVEIGIGGRDDGPGTNEIYIHRSYVSLGGAIGKVAIGHLSQATDGISEITTANTGVATQPLSLRPLIGPQVGEVADLYDGTRADGVRYDTPLIGGFQASASWAVGDTNDDVWDAALRYAGEFGGFRLAAGVGYRDGIVANWHGGSGAVTGSGFDVQTWTVTGSVMHVPSGIFLTGVYGHQEGDLNFWSPLPAADLESDGWAAVGGIEQRLFPIGKTTVYGEYGDVDLSGNWSNTGNGTTDYASGNLGVTYWGIGVVQTIDAAAMDLYLAYRQYDGSLDIHGGEKGAEFDVGDGFAASADVQTIMGGARIRF